MVHLNLFALLKLGYAFSNLAILFLIVPDVTPHTFAAALIDSCHTRALVRMYSIIVKFVMFCSRTNNKKGFGLVKTFPPQVH